MKEDNSDKRALQRSVIELCTLAIIAKNEAYTNDIVELLRQNDIIVVEGSIYPLLSNLKKAGLLTSRLEESLQGPARKYYSLTPEGRSYYNSLCANWRDLAQAVNRLLEAGRNDGEKTEESK